MAQACVVLDVGLVLVWTLRSKLALFVEFTCEHPPLPHVVRWTIPSKLNNVVVGRVRSAARGFQDRRSW